MNLPSDASSPALMGRTCYKLLGKALLVMQCPWEKKLARNFSVGLDPGISIRRHKKIMQIVVTRPSEDAEPLAAALRDMGVEPVLEPLMFIENIDGAALDLTSYQALLITSANGVRALATRSATRDTRILAVGDASAQAARQAGFQNVESSEGNVKTLARLASDRLLGSDGPLLHAAGTRVAGDLAGLLGRE